MKSIFNYLTVFLIMCSLTAQAQRSKKKNVTVKETKLDMLQAKALAYQGFFDFYYEENSGKVFLKVNKEHQIDSEFLYINSLSAGIGSNDIGLDRGQLGDERVVYFSKAGNKLLLIQPNLKYRASTDNALEKQSVKEAFAESVLFGFPIVETSSTEYLIDMTPFLMQDTHGVSQRLKRSKQGSFKLDKSRSAVSLDRTKAFPKNIELDVLLTFAGQAEGGWIRSVTPSSNSVSVKQHHSFVALPDIPFTPRDFDPRSGAIPFSYYDYSTPVETSTRKVYALRHRLEKTDPNAAQSKAKEPIVYYLDNGTPEPVRSALLEGGSWWNEAFEAAGFIDAFQIKILPDDADPLDVNYNVIQWVHRSTRGWSYGASVVDPRSGEILKGHVSLGSLRIRQDFMIAQGLTKDPYANGNTDETKMSELAIARIRQLSAHEIGHTLGFAHNFAASTNGRASVMDYPHPKLDVVAGAISYENAYAVGMGAWDKISVRYSYSQFPEGTDETKELNSILEESILKGNRFISDQDARPIGGAHPHAHLWDNGSSAIEEFNHLLKVRSIALKNFSDDQLRVGEPYSVLNDRLVPMYFLHRYQAEAIVKLIGGVDYSYGVKGPLPFKITTVAAETQKDALTAMVNSLSSVVLAIPKPLLKQLPPTAFGYSATRESFKSQTGRVFDVLGAPASLGKGIMQMILNPERVSRLIQQKALDANQLSFDQLANELTKSIFKKQYRDSYHQAIQAQLKESYLNVLFGLHANNNTTASVKAISFGVIKRIENGLKKNTLEPHRAYYINKIKRFLENPEAYEVQKTPVLPDGSPIGTDTFCSQFTF
ncbi:MAG: zinc-dependent metalloprotease [Flavobacteriaceae bacterium]|nr:zinc-dependent metalloprotease [Flavobacteriaceae bacterium]